jgi:hypothetical protein
MTQPFCVPRPLSRHASKFGVHIDTRLCTFNYTWKVEVLNDYSLNFVRSVGGILKRKTCHDENGEERRMTGAA